MRMQWAVILTLGGSRLVMPPEDCRSTPPFSTVWLWREVSVRARGRSGICLTQKLVQYRAVVRGLLGEAENRICRVDLTLERTSTQVVHPPRDT
jgi:hypothetical protein